MTLTEYINQKDPVRMPYVVLDRSEFKVLTTTKWTDGTTFTHVVIPHFGYTYVLRGKLGQYVGQTLYTTNRDGNEKAASCFRITQTQADLLRMQVQYHFSKLERDEPQSIY